MYQNQSGPFFKRSAPYIQGPPKQKQFGRKELHQDNYEKIRVKSKQNKSQQNYGNEQTIQHQHKEIQKNEEQIEYQYQYNYQADEQLKQSIEENITPSPQPANQENKPENLQQGNQEIINNKQNELESFQIQNQTQIVEQKQEIEQNQEQVINSELQTNLENTLSNQENPTSNGTTTAEPPQQSVQEKQQINFNPIPQQQDNQCSQSSYFNYAPITQNRFQPANCPNPFAQFQQFSYPNNIQYNQYTQYPQVIQYIYNPNSNQYCFMSQFQLTQESIDGNYLFLKAQLEHLVKHPQ